MGEIYKEFVVYPAMGNFGAGQSLYEMLEYINLLFTANMIEGENKYMYPNEIEDIIKEALQTDKSVLYYKLK